ncbi:MAG TPA: hypothetical protein VFO00_01775, partial [Vitreimonas sp.]|nr:hypothetical protein [Vitreimonas sp.]
MRKRYIVALALVVVLALWSGAYFVLNSNAVASADDIVRRDAEGAAPAGDTLNITVWNLGYGGLGRESDFVSDG